MPYQNIYRIFLNLILLWPVLLSVSGSAISPQSYSVKVEIKGISDDAIIAGYMKGDDFVPTDTIFPERETVKFTLQEGDPVGIYRLKLSKTLYEQVMKKPSRKIDFIYNKENIYLKTESKNLLDSMVVVSSRENMIWYAFLRPEEKIEKELSYWEKQLNYIGDNSGVLPDKKRSEIIARYNLLQNIKEELIRNIEGNYPGLFVTKIVKRYKRPFLNGNDSREKRDSVFKYEFFSGLDFSDPALIYSTVYTDCVLEYINKRLPTGATQKTGRIEILNEIIDDVIENTTSNQEVGDFIVNFLLKSFERLGLWEVLNHIADIYGDKISCDLPEKSTFQRRICYLRMSPGTVVPDFSLRDITGDTVTLSKVGTQYKLIVFWMSTCPHCEELMPELYKWYLTRDLDLEVIAVSLDDDEITWRNYIYENRFEWINCRDQSGWEGRLANDYSIYATPTMFLLNKQNEIIGKPLMFDEFIDLILRIKKKTGSPVVIAGITE